MVSFNLANRTAYQNNNWYVRNPGYKCDRSSGTVAVDIIVNENGNVISASINYGGSGGANQCMMDEALKYANLSRFEYKSGLKSQSGQIFYTFILFCFVLCVAWLSFEARFDSYLFAFWFVKIEKLKNKNK